MCVKSRDVYSRSLCWNLPIRSSECPDPKTERPMRLARFNTIVCTTRLHGKIKLILRTFVS